ncbi:MAG TPA: hypothetical protein VFL90_19105 [Methylomirabilota bacterium]|nr:hypothetical protein [Methylomirabilota bacterium]
MLFTEPLTPAPGQLQLPPLSVPDVLPDTAPPLPLTPPLTFVLSFTLVLLLTFVFVFALLLASPLMLPDDDGLALGLETAFWSVPVLWLPEPMLVELDWLVVVVWSPEPTLLLLFWLPVPTLVLGLTFVSMFGLTLYVDPLLDGLCDCPDVVAGSAASAGPTPMTSAAIENPVSLAMRWFMCCPLYVDVVASTHTEVAAPMPA